MSQSFRTGKRQNLKMSESFRTGKCQNLNFVSDRERTLNNDGWLQPLPLCHNHGWDIQGVPLDAVATGEIGPVVDAEHVDEHVTHLGHQFFHLIKTQQGGLPVA